MLQNQPKVKNEEIQKQIYFNEDELDKYALVCYNKIKNINIFLLCYFIFFFGYCVAACVTK
jgi:hypothetical protein